MYCRSHKRGLVDRPPRRASSRSGYTLQPSMSLSQFPSTMSSQRISMPAFPSSAILCEKRKDLLPARRPRPIRAPDAVSRFRPLSRAQESLRAQEKKRARNRRVGFFCEARRLIRKLFSSALWHQPSSDVQRCNLCVVKGVEAEV